MKSIIRTNIIFNCTFLLFLSSINGEDLKTTDGKIYNDVMIVEETPEFVKIKHSNGLAKIPRSKIIDPANKDKMVDAFDTNERVSSIKKTVDQIKTKDGRIFYTKDLTEVKPNEMKFVSDFGIHKVRFTELPTDIAKQIGWDPELSERQDSKDTAQKYLDEQKRQAYLQADSILTSSSFEGIVVPFQRLNAGWLCDVTERKTVTITVEKDRRYNLLTRRDEIRTNTVQVDNSGPSEVALVWGLSNNLLSQNGTTPLSTKIYLVGKYSYVSTEGGEREVPMYFTDRNAALSHLAKHGFTTIQDSGVIKNDAGEATVEAWGSGFFVSQNGHIATNYHVIEGSTSISVYTSGQRFDGTIVATDKENDLAIIKIDTETPSFLKIKPDSNVSIGDKVFTIGYPRPDTQGKNAKFTEGSISSLTGMQDLVTQYQISVPIQPGNSGGALVNESGSVVGVIVATLNFRATLSQGTSLPQSVNYAIKSSLLTNLCEKANVQFKIDSDKDSNLSKDRSNVISLAEKASVLIKMTGAR
jgi:S1-C subfamily serine protease